MVSPAVPEYPDSSRYLSAALTTMNGDIMLCSVHTFTHTLCMRNTSSSA